MRTSKPAESDTVAEEIARTVRLATQAFDGHLLTDRELDDLCDAILADAADRRRRPSAPRAKR